ncbi:sensor histidine kinase [Paracoccus sp. (in: a-proteobacteria)]|uniref:sensor histidine kinase n=1 Tax=Paracoccus sp. TaxID=267 RepID=UPI003A845823
MIPGPPQGYSLKLRLTLMMVAVLMAGGLFVSVASASYGRRAADRAFDRLLHGAATQIVEAVSFSDGRLVVDIPLSALQLLSLAPRDRVFYTVLGPDGARLTGDALPPPPEGDDTYYSARLGETPVRFARITRSFSERGFQGGVTAIVGQTTEARRALTAEMRRTALIGLLLGAAVMVALTALATRAALAPLRLIEQALLARAPQDRRALDLSVPREVWRLVQALNLFMGRVDRILSTNRRMIADASHQLRTPIAGLRAQAELAADEPDPDRLRHIVNRIHGRSVDLSRMTDQFLSRAMIIHRADAMPLVPTDLRRVAMDAAQDVCRDLPQADGAIILDLDDDPVIAPGDALSLGEAAKNLIVNALRHGKPPVRVAAARGDGRAILTVTDEGPGPQAASAAVGQRGSGGLGLYIVEAVVSAHGGRYVADRPDRGGYRAVISLEPVADPPEGAT